MRPLCYYEYNLIYYSELWAQWLSRLEEDFLLEFRVARLYLEDEVADVDSVHVSLGLEQVEGELVADGCGASWEVMFTFVLVKY